MANWGRVYNWGTIFVDRLGSRLVDLASEGCSSW